jgi:hypothetical protein
MSSTITDIVNNLPVIDTDVLIKTYGEIADGLSDKNHIIEKIYVIDYLQKYFKLYHTELHKDVKAWCAVVVLNLYKKNKTTEADIIAICIEFIEYYNDGHQKYIEDIVLYSSEYDRDVSFVRNFIQNKKRVV